MDSSQMGQGGGGLEGLFSDPNLLGKLAANPKTAKFMQDPAFVSKMQGLQSGKADMSSMMADPRMMTALGVMMGIDMVGL
jgi:stress-induced-phosphoprotein 1